MLHSFAKRLKKLHEVEEDERGFTLIELLAVAKHSVKERSTIPLRLALCDRSVYRWPKSSRR
jgi:hypothetical protein